MDYVTYLEQIGLALTKHNIKGKDILEILSNNFYQLKNLKSIDVDPGLVAKTIAEAEDNASDELFNLFKEESIKRMKKIDKIAFLYLKDGKILSSRSINKDVFYIPGGKREGDESDTETLVREIKEELSVDIIQESAKLYGVFEAQAHEKSEGVIVKMTCYTADFTGELKEAHEIEEIRWLTMNDLDIVSPVDKLIFADLHEKGLLE